MSSLDNFEVMEELGSGTYSTVFKARRITDGKIYAIKKVNISQLNDKEKNNALNEITLLSNIKHPNVVEYKDSFISDNGDKL